MAGGSKGAVYAAIGANSVVTLAKLAGFALTGSGAMLSEGVHSIADVGNQVLLAVGMKRAERPPDEEHPAGYGREAFVWALISAVGIFFLGCGVTFMHGVESLMHPAEHHESGASINLAILVFALVAEGSTLVYALREVLHQAHERGLGFVRHLQTTDDPFGVAVLLEDSAAVLGVFLALGAVGLTSLTGDPRWDAFGSIAISLLLGLVAIFLIWKNTSLLVGKAVYIDDAAKIRALLESEPAVERVVDQSAVVTGASSFRLSAELDFDGAWFADRWLADHPAPGVLAELQTPEALEAFLRTFSEHIATELGAEVDRIEARLREALPKAERIALEPD
ncbi:MAG: cation diffusion facilitator family transporter [Myxococcales bacterium]|nr:cation diffusion facilitator family transporter [Myxococcales bacterium]